jgi:hypothetical protein
MAGCVERGDILIRQKKYYQVDSFGFRFGSVRLVGGGGGNGCVINIKLSVCQSRPIKGSWCSTQQKIIEHNNRQKSTF